MSDLEFKASIETGVVNCNFETVKANVLSMIKPCDLCVIAENIDEAKVIMADVNKVKKKINDRRIELERQYMNPFNDFKNSCNELIEMLDSGYIKLSNQTRSFDESEKIKKHLEIKEYYDNQEFKLVEFERLFDYKWLNKSTAKKTWQAELDRKLESIKEDLNNINEINVDVSSDTQLIKTYYLKSLNVSNAIADFKNHKILIQQINKDTTSNNEVSEALKGSDTVYRERIVVEFKANREFYNQMNLLIKKFDVESKIIEREDINND